jgi:hypothetical protein
MHAISLLQEALSRAWLDDETLVAIIGADGVFDAAPKGRPAPYVVVARHDLIQRDGDERPGHEHRLLLHCWGDQPSRKRALEIVQSLVTLAQDVTSEDLIITAVDHVRTETTIDKDTGFARAAVSLRVMSEWPEI